MYLPLMALILKGEDLTHILKVLLMGGSISILIN